MYIKKQISNKLHCVCPPVLMLLYIMLAYLMLFTTLFNAVCLYNACLSCVFILPLTFPLLSVLLFFLNALSLMHILLTFTSFIILHHVQCFYLVGILNVMFTLFFL